MTLGSGAAQFCRSWFYLGEEAICTACVKINVLGSEVCSVQIDIMLRHVLICYAVLRHIKTIRRCRMTVKQYIQLLWATDFDFTDGKCVVSDENSAE